MPAARPAHESTCHSSQDRHPGWLPIPAREVTAGDALWVNGRWCTATSAANETEPGLVAIALTGVGLVHLPSSRIVTVTT